MFCDNATAGKACGTCGSLHIHCRLHRQKKNETHNPDIKADDLGREKETCFAYVHIIEHRHHHPCYTFTYVELFLEFTSNGDSQEQKLYLLPNVDVITQRFSSLPLFSYLVCRFIEYSRQGEDEEQLCMSELFFILMEAMQTANHCRHTAELESLQY